MDKLPTLIRRAIDGSTKPLSVAEIALTLGMSAHRISAAISGMRKNKTGFGLFGHRQRCAIAGTNQKHYWKQPWKPLTRVTDRARVRTNQILPTTISHQQKAGLATAALNAKLGRKWHRNEDGEFVEVKPEFHTDKKTLADRYEPFTVAQQERLARWANKAVV